MAAQPPAALVSQGRAPVLCVVHATRLQRVEAGVLIVSLDRLLAALRTAARTRERPAFLSPVPYGSYLAWEAKS